MPKKGEVSRKIGKLEKGEGVKAPYSYWHNVLIPETRKEYPGLSQERINEIAGKRWANISTPVKIKLIRQYQNKPRRIMRVRKSRRTIHRSGY